MFNLQFKINLEYTPRSPRSGHSFTESSHVRSGTSYTFDTNEVGIALVDLWNFGWEVGPIEKSLGWELSTERGASHALRKKEIITQRIAPTIQRLRQSGIQIFHCNHAAFLKDYPQWMSSTTEEERDRAAVEHEESVDSSAATESIFPEMEWQKEWMRRHVDDIFNLSWSRQQAETYSQIRIPQEVEPLDKDILIYSQEQFNRNLRERGIRALFYMGFETDECVTYSDYGIMNMRSLGYMTNIVRDCTTTYESAETAQGLWRTKVSIELIEKRWGYSVNSQDLVQAVEK
ncbi:isochorismatase family protein [Paenibacillus eucommiae]|uniref:Nicotinamidase-related amidase n=1 Tax=Paenibacillus eucommiae TaxID=1355755 RepID=A0ABS4J451_9BACL|nr:isochorismatase family protein [Paenibacillus eucommiae]MBP1994588.1 nicotinamidase-related amidase [Paenibacillus eucommiae]